MDKVLLYITGCSIGQNLVELIFFNKFLKESFCQIIKLLKEQFFLASHLPGYTYTHSGFHGLTR